MIYIRHERGFVLLATIAMVTRRQYFSCWQSPKPHLYAKFCDGQAVNKISFPLGISLFVIQYSSPLCTLLLCRRSSLMDTFCPARLFFLYMCPQHKVSTTVDGSLMWTLFTRPLCFHIRGTLMYQIHSNKKSFNEQ